MKFSGILSHPALYRLWQAPFVQQKLRPVKDSGILTRATRVLDVGCGPGTNASAFAKADCYVGVDISERYVTYASKRFEGDFRVADVTAAPAGFGQFDLILMNSLMHHLDDEGTGALLSSLPPLLAPGGEIQIIDLVLADGGIRRRMGLADRGAFPRTMAEWKEMIQPVLNIAEIRPFDVGLGPLHLWELVYVRAFASEV